MNIFIQIEINHWRGKSVIVREQGFLTAEECMKSFDDKHIHSINYCDYCKSKWVKTSEGWRRGVDHDGAFVAYVAKEIII